MKGLKMIGQGAAKGVGGLAGLVFLRAPFTDMGVELMAGSAIVGLICVGAYTWLDNIDDGSEQDAEP